MPSPLIVTAVDEGFLNPCARVSGRRHFTPIFRVLGIRLSAYLGS
jgi:hypothetical protein